MASKNDERDWRWWWPNGRTLWYIRPSKFWVVYTKETFFSVFPLVLSKNQTHSFRLVHSNGSTRFASTLEHCTEAIDYKHTHTHTTRKKWTRRPLSSMYRIEKKKNFFGSSKHNIKWRQPISISSYLFFTLKKEYSNGKIKNKKKEKRSEHSCRPHWRHACFAFNGLSSSSSSSSLLMPSSLTSFTQL